MEQQFFSKVRKTGLIGAVYIYIAKLSISIYSGLGGTGFVINVKYNGYTILYLLFFGTNLILKRLTPENQRLYFNL